MWGHSLTVLNCNCKPTQHSARQVQDMGSVVCGQQCVFFHHHMNRGLSYNNVMSKYSNKLSCSDFMVCKFGGKKKYTSVACGQNNYAGCKQCARVSDSFKWVQQY